MSVDRRGDIGVSKEFLDSPDIISAFNKVYGKAVRKSMYTRVFAIPDTLRAVLKDFCKELVNI